MCFLLSHDEQAGTRLPAACRPPLARGTTWSIVSGPANGSVGSVSGTSVTYTPNANFNGTDSFTFKSNDGTADSASATVTITVTAVNDAPVATTGSDAGEKLLLHHGRARRHVAC